MSPTKKFAMQLHIGKMTIPFSKCENATGKTNIKKLIEKIKQNKMNWNRFGIVQKKATDDELRKRNSTQISFFYIIIWDEMQWISLSSSLFNSIPRSCDTI